MRVVITGGSGFVGTHLTRALSTAGHQVTVVSRGVRRRSRRENVSFVRADLTRGDGDALAQTLSGADALIHLVAVIRERGAQTFQRVNVEVTERVVAAAVAAKVPHLLHQSALGADPDPRYPYLASKWQGEQLVRASGLPYTVMRPSLLFGPGDGFFTLIARLVKLNPVIPIPGDGRALFQPLSIDDLVQCYLLCVERGPQNAVYELGGPEYLSYEEIVLAVKRGLGLYRFTAHVPVRMLLPAAFLMDKLLPHPPVTPQQLRMLEVNNITRMDAVQRAFQFRPQRFEDNLDYLSDY